MKKLFSLLLIVLAQSTFCHSKIQSLVLAEFDGIDAAIYFKCLTLYNFEQGEFTSKQTIITKKDIPGLTKESSQPFEMWINYLVGNRYAVTKQGTCIDLQTRKVYNLEGNVVMASDSSIIFCDNSGVNQPKYYHFNLASHEVEKINYIESNKNKIASPNQKYFAENFFSGPSCIVIRPIEFPDSIVTRTKKITTLTNLSSSGFSYIPMMWLDNATIIYASDSIGWPIRKGDKVEQNVIVTVSTFNFETNTNKRIGSIDSIQPSISSAVFEYDVEGNLFLELYNGSMYIDLVRKEVHLSTSIPLGNGFYTDIQNPAKQVIRYQDQIIRSDNFSLPVYVKNDYIGLEFGGEDENLFYAHQFGVWNKGINKWQEFNLNGACRIVGWISH